MIQFLKKHTMPIFLIGGFIFDNFTLRRSDRLAENLFLLGYLVVSGGCILALNRYRGENERTRFWLVAAMQFCFGNLFSAFLIFYARSGALSAAWPFLLLLVLLMIGNEIYKERYQQLAFQVGAWFFATFSFLTFFLPVVFKNLSIWLFVLAGILSLLLAGVLVRSLMFFIKDQVNQSRRAIRYTVGGIFVAINLLYFTNLIPPIPLAMKDSGVYHAVTRSGGNYQVMVESTTWRDWFRLNKQVRLKTGQPMYVYSAIYSPAELDTDIVHEWQYYDEDEKSWQSVSRVVLPIVGGREGGYRSYSYLIPSPGWWRVDVETPRGQIIGRVKFEVKRVTQSPALVVETK